VIGRALRALESSTFSTSELTRLLLNEALGLEMSRELVADRCGGTNKFLRFY
jgi:hypothetical protein